ncbi:tRNA pseudouridine(55) synthase TruB [bacterium]|nr:tRNA pseudouridine(55) synthase TruB [bacterium]
MKELFAIYKPKGPSSNQMLNCLRKFLDTKKIGHAGTLDPLASGILVIGVGREATKQLPNAVNGKKEYLAKIKLGISSTTYDEEGEKTIIYNNNDLNIDINKIKGILKKFVGKIQQEPPIYSAIKINGQSAYKLARKGKIDKLKSREVEIEDIELLSFSWPFLEIRVTTAKGVYIRSLAKDIGDKLKTTAYLAELERTRVGNFDLKSVKSFEEIKEKYLKEEEIK